MSAKKLLLLVAAALLFLAVLFSLGCPAVSVRLRAAMGDANAMYEIGEAYRHAGGAGIVDPQSDPKEADRWFKMAAQKGHVGAMFSISQGGDFTNEERVMWLKKGAELGSGVCVTELIKGYSHGVYGLPQDPLEAFRWTKRGWEMDFEDRNYDQAMRTKELNRHLGVYRAHLKIALTQKGITKEETEKILEQIR
jgi:TPR repeat protein